MSVKKYIATAAALVLAAALCFPFPAAVSAQESADCGYARITEEDVYLYSSPQETSGLFILPRTYFVKITGETGEYYRVEYLTGEGNISSVRGYCRMDSVVPVDYIPETPFLVYRTQVTFSAGNGNLPDGFFTEYTVGADYYGTFPYGSSVYYYVNLDGEFGYVPASACPPLDYPENTEHTQTETPPDEAPVHNSVNAVNIVLICARSVAALGAVYFLFRPAKPAKRASPFDDYEQFD